VHTVGTFTCHFWMQGMRPWRRGDGDQYLHRATARYRQAVRRKFATYDRLFVGQDARIRWRRTCAQPHETVTRQS
jgi:hypothetical protein